MAKKCKVRFTGEVTFKELPDDRGSIDTWLVLAIAKAAENTDNTFGLLKLRWELVNG